MVELFAFLWLKSMIIGCGFHLLIRAVACRRNRLNAYSSHLHRLRAAPAWDFQLFIKSFGIIMVRSEEHTSELQSQSNLVCRLLLEKKKNKRTTNVRNKR